MASGYYRNPSFFKLFKVIYLLLLEGGLYFAGQFIKKSIKLEQSLGVFLLFLEPYLFIKMLQKHIMHHLISLFFFV